jgi:hypothetical protein
MAHNRELKFAVRDFGKKFSRRVLLLPVKALSRAIDCRRGGRRHWYGRLQPPWSRQPAPHSVGADGHHPVGLTPSPRTLHGKTCKALMSDADPPSPIVMQVKKRHVRETRVRAGWGPERSLSTWALHRRPRRISACQNRRNDGHYLSDRRPSREKKP